MTETTPLPTTDVTVFRPDLPPLDAATALIGGAIDCNKIALNELRAMRDEIASIPAMRADNRLYSALINALEMSVEKQRVAMEKIREHQSIPGNN